MDTCRADLAVQQLWSQWTRDELMPQSSRFRCLCTEVQMHALRANWRSSSGDQAIWHHAQLPGDSLISQNTSTLGGLDHTHESGYGGIPSMDASRADWSSNLAPQTEALTSRVWTLRELTCNPPAAMVFWQSSATVPMDTLIQQSCRAKRQWRQHRPSESSLRLHARCSCLLFLKLGQPLKMIRGVVRHPTTSIREQGPLAT